MESRSVNANVSVLVLVATAGAASNVAVTLPPASTLTVIVSPGTNTNGSTSVPVTDPAVGPDAAVNRFRVAAALSAVAALAGSVKCTVRITYRNCPLFSKNPCAVRVRSAFAVNDPKMSRNSSNEVTRVGVAIGPRSVTPIMATIDV